MFHLALTSNLQLSFLLYITVTYILISTEKCVSMWSNEAGLNRNESLVGHTVKDKQSISVLV